jgi:hypothetical protein
VRALAFVLLLGATLPVQACGACAEDKIASTYDHASVRQALARGHVIVYCEPSPGTDVQRVRQAAAGARGVDARSVRVSAQPLALSFVLDPKQQSPQAAVLAVQAALPAGARLAILKVQGAAAGQPPASSVRAGGTAILAH